MKYEAHICRTWVIEADSESQALDIAKEIVRDSGAAYVEVEAIEEDDS